MAGSEITHENLLDAFPGAVTAECDGHGFAHVLFPEESYQRSGSARCPACGWQQFQADVIGFVPQRFRAAVTVPDAVSGWAWRGFDAQGLYLTGPVGTGKTHAAWMALIRWCAETGTRPRGAEHQETSFPTRIGPTVVFTRMTDLLDDLRPGDDARRRVRDCQEARLLVLDDVGAEKASEWTQERLYSIIDHRYANCAPLIVTSNLPPGKLADQTGERTASRLAEMCQVVPITGTDRRRPS